MAITGLKASNWTLGAVLATACLFVSDNAPVMQGADLVTQANARVGRPLTPGSVAGVARRTTRRAYRRSYYYAISRAPTRIGTGGNRIIMAATISTADAATGTATEGK